MADRYWVGGTGTWDASTTTNWATSSGGAGGASAPTSGDNVIYDASSDAGSGYTVTITAGSCNDLTMSGLDQATIVSMGATSFLDVFGSLTLPATNLTWSGVSGCNLSFKATSGTKTITTNGVTIGLTAVEINGVGGTFNLGSALTITGTGAGSLNGSLNILNGTFSTTASNYNLTTNGLRSNNSNTRTISLNGSTFSSGAVTPLDFTTSTNLTLNAGTSQITCTGSSPTFAGGGLTYHNVSFTSAASGTVTITSANTFNNLTFTSRSATGLRNVDLGDNQTVSGTLTIGAANTAIRRIIFSSNIIGTQRTITCNGTLAALADVDFRDINAAGTVATPWTGTRIGNCLNNSNITFTTAADKYWNFVAGGNWSDTGWATSSGGAVAANNFPLAQDKVIIENTGLNTSATITINLAWQIGEIDISTRTNAMTFASTTTSTSFYKNITLSSAVTMTGTGAWLMRGATQILDVNTATFVPPLNISRPNTILQLAENTTCSSTVTLTQGTLDLNDFDLTCNIFSSSNSNTRVIDFGTGDINVTGNNASVLNMTTSTNFTYSGTPTVNFTYSGGTGTRTLSFGAATESNVLNINITAGTDTFSTGASRFKNINFTGFAGTLVNSSRVIFGNLTISSGMTLTAGTAGTSFFATSGTQTITSNGKTFDFPVVINGVGGTFEMADALTIGSTRTLTLNAGTIKFKNGTTNSVGNLAIAGSSTNQVVIQSTSPGNTYTLSATSGPVNAYFATITDCVASPITLGTQLLGNVAFSGLSFSVAAQDATPQGIFFKDDGTKMYLLGSLNDSVFQYSLSKPWNPSTATYDSVSFSVASQDTNLQAIFFKDDGTKMYLLGSLNDSVFQYSLSSAWDLSTASYDSVFFSVASQDTNPQAIFFKPDGAKMYLAGADNDTVFQYSLSSAWDLSTTSYDGVSFSIAAQDTAPQGVFFTSDGIKMFITGDDNNAIFQYSLSTPWDLSTATYDTLNFPVGNQDANPVNIYLKEGSSYILYLVGSANDSVFQYNLGNKFNAFRGAGNIYSYGNINGGNNKGINFTPLGTQAIPFF